MGVWSRFLGWTDRNPFTVDAVSAAVVGLVVVPTSAATSTAPVSGVMSDASVSSLISLVMVVAMAWRRTRPVLSVVVVYSGALLHILLGAPILAPTDLIVPWSMWSVTVHGPRWAVRVALGGAMVGSVLVGVQSSQSRLDAIAISLIIALIFLTTWSVALSRRARRESLDALIDRARRLEVERDQQIQLGAAAERARIAREMHDIVAHSLSVIIAQADGGRYAAASDPEVAARTLGTIAETGRAALTDMRRLLGVLRSEPSEPTSPPDPASGPRTPTGAVLPAVADSATGPLPATEDIATLVDRLRESGLRVSLVRVGEPRRLPPGTGLTVYRIAQEALTNVLKHAGPDPEVTVVLQWRPDRVVLEVTDDGRGAAADTDGLGHGLMGMRERATMFAGVLSAGPRPGGGFRVRAELPTPTPGSDATPSQVPDRATEEVTG